MSGGKGGFVLSSRPKNYKILPQQQRLREAAEACGIKKGITRAELLDKMHNCIPEYFKKIKDGEENAGRES